MSERSSIFDMIGPVMIGPSSSHTAGVVRIGRVARRVHGVVPEKVEITFYNSFARTYEGHGSDRAVIAGLLDMETDDERIRTSIEIAKEQGVEHLFKAVTNASALHPNTVRVKLQSGEMETELLGISRGGGLISIVEMDGFRCNFTAQHHTLVVAADDLTGSIAFITSILSQEDCNIATMTVDRRARNLKARLVFEVDSEISPVTIQYMESRPWIERIAFLPNIQV
ncbi:MAG TPA: L-serine ammonia-lyase, iron-sulfur-dependent, subunit beta [Bacteroidetes bacterium]|nr:L-serine ammonia-lyase, iron-sulfur-dependent, subunit beta [Bacteroidota bacterium]